VAADASAGLGAALVLVRMDAEGAVEAPDLAREEGAHRAVLLHRVPAHEARVAAYRGFSKERDSVYDLVPMIFRAMRRAKVRAAPDG